MSKNRMQNKINPFDIIKTTQDIPAKVIINREAPYTEAIDIVLPKGSLLFSNTHNYNAVAELSFVPHQKKQFDTIKNLYIHKITHVDKILGYTYTIIAADLQSNYETIETFEYKQLQPGSNSHIYLLAYLYLDGKIQEVDTTKYLCFIADWKPIEETKTNFKNFLLTHQEALTIIAYQIREQVKVRGQ
jgi:hypothetical protein